MIARAAARTLTWLQGRRRRTFERVWRDAAAVQERTLVRLVQTARDTEYGLAHGFHRIRSVAEYQERVPVRDHLALHSLWERALAGERDVTWPGRVRHWVRTSGTTGPAKLIPVTREALASHRQGGWDAFLMAVERAGAETLLGGPMLLLGGSSSTAPLGRDARVGDLSGLAMPPLPMGLRGLHSPGAPVSAIPDWETRLEAVARVVARQDLRLLAGMPSWVLALFERVARARMETDRPLRDLGQCWPNLEVFVHGGVSYLPYADLLDEWMGRRLARVEVYPASEAFVAVQTEAGDGLTLMLDYDVFYEFVPVEDLGSARPRRHTIADVEVGRPYAVVITSSAGLWSYLLGDTVRFTARDPLRLTLTGRTRHVIDVFGEHVTVEEVERALTRACRRTEAEVVEFTLAPRYPSTASARGGHDWLVEFWVPPDEPEEFARILDEQLSGLNTGYRSRRWRDIGMAPPQVVALPRGSFHAWMRRAGTLGDQQKVPRVTGSREIAEELLAAAVALGGAEVLAAGARVGYGAGATIEALTGELAPEAPVSS